MASPLLLSGFESGDISEWSGASGGTFSVQTTTVNPNGGNYALSLTTSTSPFVQQAVTSSTTVFASWFVRIHAMNQASTSTKTLQLGTTNNVNILINTDAGGNATILQGIGGASLAINEDQWYLCQLAIVTGAGTGTSTFTVNGVQVSALTAQTINAIANVAAQAFVVSGSPTGTVFFDDIVVSTTSLTGPIIVIGRQFTSTTPNYNTFTKSNSSTINTVWDDLPFSTATNATDAVSTGKQTGVVNFALANGAASSGSQNSGPRILVAEDTIIGAKIWFIAKTGTASDAADSTIFRTPAGGSGTDTITAFASGWATTDGYKETILATTPTTLQALNCEAGIQHNATTNTHTYEDGGLMIAMIPGVMSRDWNFWVQGAAGGRQQGDAAAQNAQAGFFRFDLQHQNPPAPKLTAHVWEFWNDVIAPRLAQEQDRQNRLAAIEPYALWYRNVPPAPSTPGGLWQHWLDNAYQRRIQDAQRWAAAALLFQNNLIYRPPAQGFDTPALFEFWIKQRPLDWQPNQFNTESGPLTADTPPPWAFWLYRYPQEWRILHQLLWRSYGDPAISTTEIFQFWLNRIMPQEARSAMLLNTPPSDVPVTPGAGQFPIIIWRHRAGFE